MGQVNIDKSAGLKQQRNRITNAIKQRKALLTKEMITEAEIGSFPFVPPPPPQYVMLPQVTEHVSLHSKSLCKNIARSSGGCKQYAPTKLGGTNGKDPRNH